MDVNDLRVIVTLACFGLFVALMAHTWSRRRADEHSAAARLPFNGDSLGDQP
jgi:cbb3-type cytochrome oxidase subunit 3